MKKKFKGWFCFFLALAALMLPASVMPAYAYTDGLAQEAADTEKTPIKEKMPIKEKTPIKEETPSDEEAAPFSLSGNGQLVDDISDDETKQFLTIQTKNGNTFFMVLDRSRNTENVYMLSLIDENDLADFLEEAGQESETEAPPIEIPEPETVTETEAGAEETEQEPEESGMNVGALLALALLLIGGIGGYYYFRVIKPKKEEEDSESENMEFSDDSPYIADGQDGSDEDDPQDEDEF